jgi:hypothetical protein
MDNQTKLNGNTSQDPFLKDAAGGDYHLRSEAGRYDPGTTTWVTDPVSSPCIDAGDPAADYSQEPTPNGGRINMGFDGNTAEASKSQEVYFTVAPSASPPVCDSGAAVPCQVQAVCRLGHDLTYKWTPTDAGGGTAGSFDDRSLKDPVWTAPMNPGDGIMSCTLTVRAACTGGATTTGSVVVGVKPAADEVTITAPPSGTPNPVASFGKVQCSVTAEDSRNHQLSYAWTAEDAQGNPANTFDDKTKQNPVWTAPANYTGQPAEYTIEVTVTCTGGQVAVMSYKQAVLALGDVDGDGDVTGLDLEAFIKAWRQFHAGEDDWDRRADLNGNTVVDADDARLMLGAFLSAWAGTASAAQR